MINTRRGAEKKNKNKKTFYVMYTTILNTQFSKTSAPWLNKHDDVDDEPLVEYH